MESEIDYKRILVIGAPILLLGGIALGAFVIAPAIQKRKAKDTAKSTQSNKKVAEMKKVS